MQFITGQLLCSVLEARRKREPRKNNAFTFILNDVMNDSSCEEIQEIKNSLRLQDLLKLNLMFVRSKL